MTDFRARGTIMGLAGLTAVFGMGTGGTPPVSSPEIDREAVKPLDRGWFRDWSHRTGPVLSVEVGNSTTEVDRSTDLRSLR